MWARLVGGIKWPRKAKATKEHTLKIPIKDGKGTETISQATLGKTLSGSITINHGMQRIDTLGEDDIPDEWIVALKIDGNVAFRQTVPNGSTITHDGIPTKFWGKTKFTVELEYSLPWDLTATIELKITY